VRPRDAPERKEATVPRQQLNTPARRTITVHDPAIPNGLKPGEWALGWAEEGDRLHDGQHWENTPTLFLGWQTTGNLDHGPLIYIQVDADEVLRAADEIKRNREQAAAGIVAPLEHWDFHTVVLTRDEMQQIVRTTRRARNAVYGGDE
jgi:hypothetical protein